MPKPGPLRPRESERWRLHQARVTASRVWDGEAVIYDDLSGDTFKLDIIMAEIFARLQQGDATPRQIVEHLAQSLEVEIDLRLERLVEIALERFQDSGLAAPAATPAPDRA